MKHEIWHDMAEAAEVQELQQSEKSWLVNESKKFGEMFFIKVLQDETFH